MYKFGARSRANLSECDQRIQDIADIAIRVKDHSVIEGHRGEDEQNALFESALSKVRYPHGKHNKRPSLAVDVQTYPRPEDEGDLREEQIYLLGIYRGIAAALDIPCRIGGDWDSDGEVADNGWDDLFHFELDG